MDSFRYLAKLGVRLYILRIKIVSRNNETFEL